MPQKQEKVTPYVDHTPAGIMSDRSDLKYYNNGANPFINDAFFNMPTKPFLEGEFEEFVGDPFDGLEWFIETADDDAEDKLTNHQRPPPHRYQLRTKGRHGQYSSGYSSDESLEHSPYKLSSIPEESDEHSTMRSPSGKSPDSGRRSASSTRKSPDSDRKSPDFVAKYLQDVPKRKTVSFQEEVLVDEAEVPWYEGASQDTWETTPAYRREEVVCTPPYSREEMVITPPLRSEKVVTSGNGRRMKSAHRLLVTEEITPTHQVRPPGIISGRGVQASWYRKGEGSGHLVS